MSEESFNHSQLTQSTIHKLIVTIPKLSIYINSFNFAQQTL